jgi:hypothetical protein
MTFAAVLAGIQAAISLAPGVVAVVEKGKALITSLFTAGVISIEIQNAAHAHVDAIAAAVASGEVPPQFKVEADPAG